MRKKRGRVLVVYLLLLVMIILPQSKVISASTLTLVYDGKTVKYTKAQVGFTVNGKNIALNNIPGIIIDDNAMGNYVDIFKTGLQATCSYNSSKKQLTIKKFDKTVVLKLNTKTATVNGKKKTMETSVRSVRFKNEKQTKIMVPVRFVAENLGYTYTWDGKAKKGRIKYNWLELYKDGKWGKYVGTKAKISYNGKVVSDANMPGIIENATVLMDGTKVVTNGLGGSCVYNSKDKTVTVKKEKDSIVYTLGKKTAVVNGQNKQLETAPIRVKNRATGKYYLMLPARFTANELGYVYNWNSKDKISEITDKNSNTPITVTNGSISFRLPDGVKKADVKNTDYYYKKQFAVTIPGNYLDFYKKNTININNKVVTGSKVSVTSAGKTKILFTTSKLQGYKIHISGNDLWIEVGNPKNIYKNIVVLDCGHGGTDPGAQSGGYNEKDVTYAILYRYAKTYFNANTSEIKAYWTRYNDTFVTLSDRAAYANTVGADLFISLHMNSAANTAAKGTEVYYSTSNNTKQKNGLTSQKMASMFEKKLVSAMGTVSRGVKSANYTVIYRNSVPAILVELGFISNSSDRANLVDASFQKKAAKNIYETTKQVFAQYPTGR